MNIENKEAINQPKALILNGAESSDSLENAIGPKIVSILSNNGWNPESIALRDKEIAYCCGLFYCWTKTPGICAKDDFARDIAKNIVESQLLIFVTPITFGGYSWQLKKALDRIICIISPSFANIHGETHHHKRYDTYPDILGVGIDHFNDIANQETFKRLVGRNAINFHCQNYQAEILIESATGTSESTDNISRVLEKWCPECQTI
jgi:multimeric flavodoxin WrbA